MAFFDRYFLRGQGAPHLADLSPAVMRRLQRACGGLSASEEEMAKLLGLDTPPRLLMVDEEEGVIVLPEDRRLIEDP